jgi:hypothetical protein
MGGWWEAFSLFDWRISLWLSWWRIMLFLFRFFQRVDTVMPRHLWLVWNESWGPSAYASWDHEACGRGWSVIAQTRLLPWATCPGPSYKRQPEIPRSLHWHQPLLEGAMSADFCAKVPKSVKQSCAVLHSTFWTIWSFPICWARVNGLDKDAKPGKARPGRWRAGPQAPPWGTLLTHAQGGLIGLFNIVRWFMFFSPTTGQWATPMPAVVKVRGSRF